ncbi:MAG: GntP family permease, partial [Lachnospiraceae bacterium]|nr:GntP family permease [Lachnospiraceae bacterium]
MLGILGLIIAMILIIVSMFFGWHIFPIAVAGSIIIILFNGMNFWEGLSVNFVAGWTSRAGGYYLLFALGALFGEFLAQTGAARSIAYKLMDGFGAKNGPIAIFIITLALTMGGVNAFVVVFTIFPLAMVMCKEANIPRGLALAGMVPGAGTITQGMIPYSPSTQNIIPTNFLSTTIAAGPVIGIICSAITFIFVIFYIKSQMKSYAKKGIGFVEKPEDGLAAGTGRIPSPNIFAAVLPVLVVVALNIGLTQGTSLPPIAIVCIALACGSLAALILMFKHVGNLRDIINKGFVGSITPLMNTAAIIGFGTVVQASPAFATIKEVLAGMSDGNPYVIACISTNILCGVSGSASGGMNITLSALGDMFVNQMGANPSA